MKLVAVDTNVLLSIYILSLIVLPYICYSLIILYQRKRERKRQKKQQAAKNVNSDKENAQVSCLISNFSLLLGRVWWFLLKS